MTDVISYQEACLWLFTIRTPRIIHASSALLEISAALRVSAAIATLFPKDYKRRLNPLKSAREEIRKPRKDNEATQISTLVSQLINKYLCPLDDLWLNEEAMNFADDATIHIAVQGLKMTMDDFGDWMSGDPADVPDHLGLQTMVGLLWGWSSDEADMRRLWARYNDRFNWGVPDYPDLADDLYIDVNILRRKLKKANAGCLCTLLLAIDGSTDNVFFDFDYEYWQPIDLTVSSLLALHKDWKKALSLIKECNQAFDLLAERPEFYKVFLDAYISSLRARTRN
jgi:hypothetical protein